MTLCKSLAAAGCLFSLITLTACTTPAVNPADRDRSGTYDGVWIGEVSKPRASVAMLPGNWTMDCEWEPHEVYFVIDDGRVQLGKLEQRAAISKEGKFRYDLSSGVAGSRGGTLAGNGRFMHIFSGSLSGDNPKGIYKQYVESIGAAGCSATVRYRRADNTEA